MGTALLNRGIPLPRGLLALYSSEVGYERVERRGRPCRCPFKLTFCLIEKFLRGSGGSGHTNTPQPISMISAAIVKKITRIGRSRPCRLTRFGAASENFLRQARGLTRWRFS